MCNLKTRLIRSAFWVLLQPMFMNAWKQTAKRWKCQFEIKIVIVRGDTDVNTTYLIWIKKKSKREPAIICKRVNCQRITSKNTRSWWVDTWARDTVRWYWSADTPFWQLSIDDNIDVQSAFSWAPKVVRKCESKHWYACGADGRSLACSLAVRSHDYQIFWDG